MPGYYSRPTMGPRMPITPPDSGSGFTYGSMHYPQDPYASQQTLSHCRTDNTYDYSQQSYMQPPVAPAPPTYQYQQSNYQSSSTLPPIQGFYEPMGAPILPPLRIHDQVPFGDDYQRRLQQEQQQNAAAREQQRNVAKEEKATGGVSAKLDYDMERMTDFVTEAAQSIFHQQVSSPPSFRKWVHQVLSATRLPSATILLSLHYLNDRLANFPDSVVPGENQVYRLLAVALILGSKFLDDNTFINRSWSDVTAIKIGELNMLEMKWLHLINYDLHVDPKAPNGLQAWIDAWKKYDAEYVIKMQPARLAPIDTNVLRHSHNTRERHSPYPTPATASSNFSRTFDTALANRSSQYPTPYGTSDPWASSQRHVDDYYKRTDGYSSAYEMSDAPRQASDDRTRQSTYPYSQGSHSSYYATPTYSTGWDQTAWSSTHRYDCSCSTCAYQQHYRPYPMSSGYAAQPVMG